MLMHFSSKEVQSDFAADFELTGIAGLKQLMMEGKLCQLSKRAADLDSTNVDVQLGFGIYNYYAAVIPDEYPMIKPLMLFFPSGDKEKGIEQLNNAAFNGKYAKYEAQYFLMTLYFTYENNAYKADEYAETLTKEFPDNPIFERWKGRIEAKKGDYATASIIFQNVIDKADSGLTGYNVPKTKREADYYIAYQYFNTDKLDSAMIYFDDCAKISKQVDEDEESGFQVNAVLYIGKINDLWNKRDAAISNYKKVLDMNEYANSHKLAEGYIEKPFKK